MLEHSSQSITRHDQGQSTSVERMSFAKTSRSVKDAILLCIRQSQFFSRARVRSERHTAETRGIEESKGLEKGFDTKDVDL
jgi:hypothetical protein